MHAAILELLSTIESDYQVEILYACESGSRAWGFASPDSDYDIRFIYRRTAENYASIFETSDTIEIPIANDLDPGGWDMKKALSLLAKSNGPLIEWLHSPIVYVDKDGFRDSWQALVKDTLQPEFLRKHYLGLAHRIAKNKLAGDAPSAKSYLYVLRALLAAQWVQDHEATPPVPFAELLPQTDAPIRTAIDQLVTWKAGAGETSSSGRIETLDLFIAEQLDSSTQWCAQTGTSIETVKHRIDQAFARYAFPTRTPLLRKKDVTLSRLRKPDLVLLDALSGSHAYGTQTPDSDQDYKGVFVMPDSFHAGMESIEQVSDETNDQVYYELSRFFQLLTKNNPTALELLCSPVDCIRQKHPAFDLIRPELFLSRLCEKSFSNYAAMQVKRARGLNKKIVNPEPETRKHLREFCYILENQGSIPLAEWLVDHGLEESQCGLVSVDHAPSTYALFHDSHGRYSGLFSQKTDAALLYSSVPHNAKPIAWFTCNENAYRSHCKRHKEYWSWVANRNEHRYQNNAAHGRDYDSKNMMHTVRLLDMALEIAQEGRVNVRRPNSSYLLEIKNGTLSYEDILSLSETRLDAIQSTFQNSSLPEKPDEAAIHELLREVQTAFSIPSR